MTEIEFSWYLPCDGDGHWMCVESPERPPTISYLSQVARAAEHAGFDSILVPVAFSSANYGIWAPRTDAFTAGLAALSVTERIRVIVAHRPGFVNPGVFAQMCATADRMSGGRLALNVVTAGAPGDMEQYGDVLAHDLRYARAEEFVRCLQLLWTERQASFQGTYYQLSEARLEPKPARAGGPPFYLAGASEAAVQMAAKQADVYMMSAETVEGVAKRIADVRERAEAHGRTVRFCVAGTMFCRETDEAARAWAREFAEHADLRVLAERQAAGRSTRSVEDLRFRAGTNIQTWLGPNLWSGISHLAYGSAWVGSYKDLSDLFVRYAEVGVSMFQIYGYPYLEEALHVGERFVPLAKRAILERGLAAASGTGVTDAPRRSVAHA